MYKRQLKYLGHLELIHTVEQVVRRAKLPYAVTQGFSPHMRIAYTSALPVGTSSTAEYFDVYLTELIPAEDALARLQAAAPVDLRPIDSAYVELRRPALTAEINKDVYKRQGVIGQIIEVSATTSTVRLVSDEQSGISAMVQGSRAQGMLCGQADGTLRLEYVVSDAEVSAGDIIITSGIGGSFPKGLPLGTVASINRAANAVYYTIVVRPASTAENKMCIRDSSTMCLITACAVGVYLIWRISVPFTPPRRAVFVFVIAGLAVGVIGFPGFFSIARLKLIPALLGALFAAVGCLLFALSLIHI